MIKRGKSPRVFFGWWTVMTGSFLALWGFGFQNYGFSAMFKPISSELGFNRAATSVAPSIGRLQGGIEAPLSGWITDRFGPRWIVFSGVALMASGLILMNFIESLWSFYVVWGVMVGTGFNMAVSVPLLTAISNWFVKKRGTALGIQAMFVGLSAVLVLPLVAWLTATQGWRTTCVIGGVVLALVGLPLVWFFVKQHRPEYYGLLPDGASRAEEVPEAGKTIASGVKYAAEVQEVEFTIRQAMRTPAFWLLIVVSGILGLATSALNIHCIPFLTDRGIDPVVAGSVMAIIGAASIPARVTGGFLADHIGRDRLRFLLAGMCLLPSIGIIVFILNQTMAMIYVWFILWGMGMGAAMTINSPIRARYFGRKAFGSISGSSTLLVVPFGVAAPIYLGWVYDTTNSYVTGFILIAVLLVLASLIVCFMVPPRKPTQVSDIGKFI